MKPTLKQLKRRPALWVFASDEHYVEPRITMPDGSMWSYWNRWTLERLEQDDWHEHALKYYEFGGWL